MIGGRAVSVAFDRPVETPDGSGGVETTWSEAQRFAARLRYLRGGEEVMAARLSGRQPVIARIRRTAGSEQIATEWRMRDTRNGDVYNIRAVTPVEDGLHLDLLCESGVAV